MTRYPGLSKGCAECRKRRIKCDEKLPACSQCSRTKRNCPGATQGRIFLTHSGSSRGRKQTRSTPILHQHDSHQQNILDISSPRLFQTQIAANFISYFAKSAINKTKPQTGWMTRLVTMISDDDDYHKERKLSVLSASLALYATTSGNTNPACAVAAREYYGVCLQRMRTRLYFLQKSPQTAKSQSCREEDVCMALMLAYYEIISATAPEAYFQHVRGAEAFLRAMGVDVCLGSQVHDLFCAIRLHMLYVSTITKVPSILASPDWTTVPFENIPKTTFDNIIDVIMQLSNLPKATTPDILSTAISRLYSIGKTLSSGESTLIPDNSETAVTVAFYSLAWLLISARTNANKTDNNISTAHGRFALLHCNNILRAGACLDDCKDGCGYTRMILPLRSVIELSPDMLQREGARYRLESWRVSRGLSGLCSVALAKRA